MLPELFLTRWLRCMLSREFSVQTSMELWDVILSGIPSNSRYVRSDCKLLALEEDPYSMLEFLILAMIIVKRDELFESDFSTILSLFMKYDEPTSTNDLTSTALHLKKALLEGHEFHLPARK